MATAKRLRQRENRKTGKRLKRRPPAPAKDRKRTAGGTFIRFDPDSGKSLEQMVRALHRRRIRNRIARASRKRNRR